jgi:hypothetical protein
MISNFFSSNSSSEKQPHTPDAETVKENQAKIQSLLDKFMQTQDEEDLKLHKKGQDYISIKIEESKEKSASGSLEYLSVETIDKIETFLTQLSTCYQLYGCPTHIIEVNMVKVAKGLGLDVDFVGKLNILTIPM